MHNTFLNIKGGKKMSKSDNNFLTLKNAFIKKNINPLVYRFAFLQTHYRKPMEYNYEIMKNAEKGLKHLKNQFRNFKEINGKVNNKFKDKFLKEINNDLNAPKALAVVQEMLKSNLSNKDKKATLLEFDLKILGVGIADLDIEIKEDIKILEEKRINARIEKNWKESDRLRNEIEKLGYTVEDGKNGMRIFKK